MASRLRPSLEVKLTGFLLVVVMLTGCASHQCWWGAEAVNPKCVEPLNGEPTYD